MKYKPCCDRRCSLANCETREEGGCACCCHIADHILLLKSIIEGYSTPFVFFPSKEALEEDIKNMTPEARKYYEHCRDIIAPERLKKAVEKLNSYLVDTIDLV